MGQTTARTSKPRDFNFNKGLLAYEQGFFEEAIGHFEACLQTTEDATVMRITTSYVGECYSKLGIDAIRSARFDDAADFLLRASRLNPNFADIHFNLALAYQGMQNRALQKRALEKALQINPRYALARLHQGIIAYEEGDFIGGMKLINEAVEWQPGFLNERLQFAIDCHLRGQKARALSNLKVLETVDASDANTHMRLGDQFAKQELWFEAVEEYERALRFAPSYADIRNKKGHALIRLGRLDDAEHELRQALRINDDYADAWAELGVVFRLRGNLGEAQSAFAKALDLDPYHVVARENLPFALRVESRLDQAS